MRWLIVGAGAIGAYMGGRLHAADISVKFVVRSRRLEQLSTRGLRIESPLGSVNIPHPSLITATDNPGPVDVIVLAVKGQHLDNILPWLDTLPPTSALLPFLNGIEHITTLKKRYGTRLLGGIAYIESTLNTEGDVIHLTPLERFLVGALNRSQDATAQRVVADLSHAGLHTALTDQIYQELWLKFLFLDTFSLMTTTTNKPIGELMTYPECRVLDKDLIAEAFKVAQTSLPNLSEQTPDILFDRLASLPPTMMSSMSRDKQHGLPLEADHLQGGLIRQAAIHQIATPIHQALYATLVPFIQGV